MKNTPQRLLVIGLDVGDGRLIKEWCKQGFLPVFNILLTGGTWGWLSTTAEILHVSAWPSLYTGTLPGKHGVYYTFQPAPHLQGARRFGPNQYGQLPFWQILSDAGKRCTILDAPYTHPYEAFKGIQVFEWGTWAHYWKPVSMPNKLMGELTRQCGTYPLGIEANQIGLSALDPADLQRRLAKAVAAKANAVCWLMAQAPWDLFLAVFGETHPAAHYCWPQINRSEPGRPDDSSRVHLRKTYEAIDQAIGKILTDLDEDVTVMILSGDGVGPNYAGWHLLPEVLQRLGFSAGSHVKEQQESANPTPARGKTNIIKSLRDFVPKDFRQAVSRMLPTSWRDFLAMHWATSGIEWSRTRAYCLPTDLEGCIRINLKGREPSGIVAEGAEYNEVCEELTTGLLELTNPRTGRPAVRRVVRADKAMAGDRRHYLPDLVVLWEEDAEIIALESRKIGIVSAPSLDARTGTHQAPGFVLGRGPFIPKGQELKGGHVVDIAPTILAQFGVPRPQSMDGRVLGEVLQSR
jgi:predicted AlkP superfamily phosphohydrolase/phosphomutase